MVKSFRKESEKSSFKSVCDRIVPLEFSSTKMNRLMRIFLCNFRIGQNDICCFIMSLLMACGESEGTVEKTKEEIVEKKVVKKDPAKKYKALVGLGKTKEVSEFLGKSGFPEQQKAEKQFFWRVSLEYLGVIYLFYQRT